MSLELRKKEMELKRVEMARMELEFKIEERMEEIGRLQSMIDIQKNKERELKLEITTLTNKEN